jgi:hypothetical protein
VSAPRLSDKQLAEQIRRARHVIGDGRDEYQLLAGMIAGLSGRWMHHFPQASKAMWAVLLEHRIARWPFPLGDDPGARFDDDAG